MGIHRKGAHENISGETGRPAISSRIAFGTIFIKEYCHITVDDTVQQLQENSYMQYFVGLHEFHAEPLFDPSMVQDYEKLFPRWLRDRLAVIPAVYRQQKTTYDNHTHSCEDRIVSLEQPHVRPIQRGKRPNSTEFGQKLHLSVVNGYTFLEQTSWSNFNEGGDLEAAVEDYKRKFGCYPSAVLADKIYQTRSNKLFCSERGIRLSGPPLGRRKTSETDAKIKRQMYKDSCERNAIEGRNGNSKRRVGLDRIFSKLDETPKTEAALILLAMNASLRLVRWLALFLRSLLLPFHFLCFSVGPNSESDKSEYIGGITMLLYLVRHGKDDDSIRGGWSNHSLVPFGVEQVNKLALEMVVANMSIDYIIPELKYRKLGGSRKKPKPYLYFVEGYA